MDKATARAVHASAQAALCDGATANPLGSGRPELACACLQELPTCHSHGHRGAASVPHEMQTLQRRVLLLFSIGFLLSCGFCCFARGAIGFLYVFFKSFKKLKTG